MLGDLDRVLKFEPFHIDHLVDQRRRFQLDLDPRFPLAVKPYSFVSFSNASRFNWHERLELFLSITARGRFRMGGRIVGFSYGDVVVVENLKLHGLVDCEGTAARGIVITFQPELICNPGSCPCDSVYLLPFFPVAGGPGPVVRAQEKLAPQIQAALCGLVQCFFSQAGRRSREAGAKAYLLSALYHIARHFGVDSLPESEYDGRRKQSLRFGRLYEYLWENFAGKVTVADAAAMAGMSQFRFMRFFKQATGMTFVTYLNQLRLASAHRLLAESDAPIAQIAARAGFGDQSYFDRRFREHYGLTPREVRARAESSKSTPDSSSSSRKLGI